jgi:hypothetical protein
MLLVLPVGLPYTAPAQLGPDYMAAEAAVRHCNACFTRKFMLLLAGLPYTPPAQLGPDYMAAEAAACHSMLFLPSKPIALRPVLQACRTPRQRS